MHREDIKYIKNTISNIVIVIVFLTYKHKTILCHLFVILNNNNHHRHHHIIHIFQVQYISTVYNIYTIFYIPIMYNVFIKYCIKYRYIVI